MDKPSSSRPPQKSAAGRRVRLIPSTPRPRGATPPPAQPVPPNMGIQPPETFERNLYSNIIREAMGRWNREEIEVEGGDENLAEPQNSASSSSSLRFSDGRSFDEIADEVIQRMQEEEREGVSGETQELKEPGEVLAEKENRAPQEDPVREILDLTGAEEEGTTASGDWRAHMENAVNQLLIENAEQNGTLKAQREQLNQLFGIVERMVSCREEGTQASRRPLPASSIASQNKPSRHNTETHLAGTSRKRKPSTTNIS